MSLPPSTQRSAQPAIFRMAFSSANDRFSLPFDLNSSFFRELGFSSGCTLHKSAPALFCSNGRSLRDLAQIIGHISLDISHISFLKNKPPLEAFRKGGSSFTN